MAIVDVMESKARWLDETEADAWMGYRRMKGLLDLQVARDLAAAQGTSIDGAPLADPAPSGQRKCAATRPASSSPYSCSWH